MTTRDLMSAVKPRIHIQTLELGLTRVTDKLARGLALFGLDQESELDKKLRGNNKAKQFKRHVILNIEMLARIESVQVASKSFEY